MHHQEVKSNLSGATTEKEKVGSKGYECDQPLCPKPRKLPPAVPEFLKPLRCSTHSQPKGNEESRVLNMITEKNTHEKELVCSAGCLPSCYSGSPPRRTENPLIHDVEFLHQMDIVSPFSRTKLSDKCAFTSA
ncbi:uncharacterized protein LOC129310511 [Prosopis cineraria]|uniref:uncharacterized protein LOC129310511 n=1 Tax=Prosopis cineraria TaxID=364024 RepID=UPI00241081A2|nr:uncharacterized protein LOC129310511 [Prosopis cineraria]